MYIDESEHRLIQVFRRLMKVYHDLLRDTLRKHGLYKAQPYILTLLQENPGITLKELAEKMQVTKSTIGTSIKRMEKMGLVTRAVDELDSRCRRINITEQGINALKSCDSDISKLQKAMYSKIAPEEEEIVFDIFNRLIEGLSDFKPI